MQQGPAQIRVGTSGYVYPHWKGLFYPASLPAKDQFAFYARHFDTLELNTTFYRLPTEATVRRWAAQAPPGFLFAVKGSRYLTHVKRLRDPEEGLLRFFDALDPLADRIGPVLWQLPPQMGNDLPRLVGFLERLPVGFQHVLEFRHPGWYSPEVFAALEEHSVSLCLHDLLDVAPPFPPPGPIYYRRFHGVDGARPYGERRLRRPAAEVRRLAEVGRPCFAYFNNDAHGFALADAFQFRELLGRPRPGAPSHVARL